MKKTAAAQIILGILSALAIYQTYQTYSHLSVRIMPGGGPYIEIIPLILGFIILRLSAIQWEKQARFVPLQIVCGLVILILPVVYSAVRADWIIVILIAAAFTVIVSGFIQLFDFRSTSRNTEKNTRKT
jgi:predicted outer membrane lipoprotein